jgi:CheY-like chemotaxis protein
MKLEMLLVTNDREVVNAVRPAIERLGIAVQLRAEPMSAGEVCNRRRFDGLILDLDVGPDSIALLKHIRQGRANHLSSVLAVTSAGNHKELLSMGANFALPKPLSADRFDQYLRIALNAMVREHRRYFRFPVQLPVSIASDGGSYDARIVNVSEGGLSVRGRPATAVGNVKLFFEVCGGPVQACGQIVWADGFGAMGIQFTHVLPDSAHRLRQWLDLLAAGQHEADAPTDIGLVIPRLVH